VSDDFELLNMHFVRSGEGAKRRLMTSTSISSDDMDSSYGSLDQASISLGKSGKRTGMRGIYCTVEHKQVTHDCLLLD
jgi:hypothetical protein